MSRLTTSVLLAALWLPITAVAQTPAQAPPARTTAVAGATKLGWINLQEAIFTCEEGKKDFAELQKYLDSKKAEMQSMKKEVDNLQNQLDVQGPKLTDEARADLEDELDSKNTGLQRFQQDSQKDIDNRRVRITNRIGKKMLPIIEKVSKAKGIDAVLIFNQSRDAYINPSLNVTDEVIKGYNQTYAAGGSSAPAKKP